MRRSPKREQNAAWDWGETRSATRENGGYYASTRAEDARGLEIGEKGGKKESAQHRLLGNDSRYFWGRRNYRQSRDNWGDASPRSDNMEKLIQAVREKAGQRKG